MACSLHWIPDSLYNYSISTVVNHFDAYEKDLRMFHGGIIFDVYYKLYKEGLLPQLEKEFEDIDLFGKVLKDVCDKRVLLHNCFQALMDHGYETATKLAEAYLVQCSNVHDSKEKEKVIQLGLSLGIFLIDAGWFLESEIIHLACLSLSSKNMPDTPEAIILVLECHKRLLRIRNMYCKFKEAKETVDAALSCVQKIKRMRYDINLAGIYSELSAFYFIKSSYKEAYSWGCTAVGELSSSLSPRDIVNVLRISSKACVAKKRFRQAELLIKQAVHLARERFGNQNLLVADALLDYGYYLLHIDSTGHSIKVYQRALDIRTSVLGGKNLLVAIAHEDLAYASYVYEYSSGRFKDAREHVEKALRLKESLLCEDHFLLPSCKRVNALILEEIAIDSNDKEIQEMLFAEAEELHTSALQITQQCLGELNVLTGKHYGNLGRLYQSMRKFSLAEKMHIKAITIKKNILGAEDYEVAISMGHLASLYNYDLDLWEEAEALYLSAINIGLKQFGKGYSGLEYDYRGLLRVYASLGELDKVVKLHADLHAWKLLRDQTIDIANKTSPLALQLDPILPEDIYQYFSSIQ